ncbi:hypothetical protein [Geodermatophilus normandii]|nr:hypothetical protein [Geodermatophilus normandii]
MTSTVLPTSTPATAPVGTRTEVPSAPSTKVSGSSCDSPAC